MARARSLIVAALAKPLKISCGEHVERDEIVRSFLTFFEEPGSPRARIGGEGSPHRARFARGARRAGPIDAADAREHVPGA
jgi:hypothetical protein